MSTKQNHPSCTKNDDNTKKQIVYKSQLHVHNVKTILSDNFEKRKDATSSKQIVDMLYLTCQH